MSSGRRCNRASSSSRRPWRWASARSATHSVAVLNATRCPARQARIPKAIERRLLCLSRAVSGGADPGWTRRLGRVRAGGFEDAEEVAGDVALEATLDLARRLALGEPARGVGAR